MKYLVIGGGGTGGCIAGYMHNAGKDVTLIARGKHLEAIKNNGLTINRQKDTLNIKINATTESEYSEKADVIFLCVKYYSLEETYSLIQKASTEETIVIPVLNVYGTGEKMKKSMPNLDILNGCIYIASEIQDFGTIKQSGEIFKVVYGRVDGSVDEKLETIKQDLADSKIEPTLSRNIRVDTLKKFSMVSCMAAAGIYYNAKAREFKQNGEERALFISCVKEIINLSKAMDSYIGEEILQINLSIIDNLGDDASTSLQRDLSKGGNSEVDGLIFEVVRLGKKFGVQVPCYQKIADKLQG